MKKDKSTSKEFNLIDINYQNELKNETLKNK